MAFLIGGANSATGGYNIANSLRSNQADGAYLSDAISSPNTDIFTISMWIKPSLLLSGSGVFFEIGKSLTGEAGDYTTFSGHFDGYTDHGGRSQFDAYDGVNNAYNIRWGAPSSYKIRDPSAWYHIVMRMDSSQGVLANRARFYINGEDISSRLTKTVDPDQNDDYFHATGSSVYFPGGVNTGGKWNGYIAECAYIDGTSYAPGTFGETDEDSGIWKPKDFKADVTFGTNGLYLEFKQSGTDTDASGLGADTSGNDNHMAVTNFAATDQCTDTPTNNFATFNPLIAALEASGNATTPTYSEGNCKTVTADSGKAGGSSTIGVANGKWYAEFEFEASNNSGSTHESLIGVTDSPQLNASSFGKVGERANDVAYSQTGQKMIGDSATSYGNSYAEGDIVGVALDLDNNAIYFSKNGTFQDSGDPTSGASKTGAIAVTAPASTVEGVYYFAVGESTTETSTHLANFGAAYPAAISSGNADANGYGNFEYAVPSGYFALCTKNLAEYG